MRYLEAIYRLKSYTKAAEELFISQPSLSNAIHSLEKELGVSLIDRSRQPLRFTFEGERFMWHVYKILKCVREAEEDIAEMSERKKHSLMLIWPSITANDYILPKIYTDFHRQYPIYNVVVQDATIQSTMTRLLSEEVDLALVNLPDNLDLTAFSYIPVMESSVWVMLHRAHPLAQQSAISFEMLEDQTILTFQRGSLIRRKIEDSCEKAKIRPAILSVNQMGVAVKLVQQGYGISFTTMDNTKVDIPEMDLVLRPLEQPIIFQKGFLLKRGRQTSPGVNKLIKFVKETVAELQLAEKSREPLINGEKGTTEEQPVYAGDLTDLA